MAEGMAYVGGRRIEEEPGSSVEFVVPVGPTKTEKLSPTRIRNGKVTVTAGGVRVRFPNLAIERVRIKADAANAGPIYIGDRRVLSANGYPLAAGESTELTLGALGQLWVNTANAGDSVRWIAA
jgi:hypothetical protein